MDNFPHLKFSENIIGKARLVGSGKASQISLNNRENRINYSKSLLEKTSHLKTDWQNHIQERKKLDLPELDEKIEPLFLKVNPILFEGSEFNLNSFQIEIISQEEDGFIIGASLDNLKSLEEKIKAFGAEIRGGGVIADFWEIVEGNRENWRTEHILSNELISKWDSILDKEIYEVEVSIAFDKPIGKKPDENKRGGQKRLDKYNKKLEERDNQLLLRQNHFEKFVSHYGEINSSFVELEDSFACEISITGKGLKDLVVNYPFVFEVNEIEDISGDIEDVENLQTFNLEIIAPASDAPEIGVIDSGIMENHVLLEKAIISKNSKSYLINNNSVSDEVQMGGHGTRVAGAILYPKGITSKPEQFQLPCFIRNIRVLNQKNKLEQKFPAELMQKIVEDNSECSIFNLSINSKAPFRLKHMSSWASMLDKLIHDKGVLFVNSAGNVDESSIREYLNNGNLYPEYLFEAKCRLANPAQSSFSIVVGSINHLSINDIDWQSLGNEDQIAAYSRIGTGIWGHIKPDVVEYGGGIKVSKNGLNLLSNKDTATELISSTLNGGSAYGNDAVGTSFATPKVTYIVAELYKLYKSEANFNNLIRALLIQGARLPGDLFQNPTKVALQQLGYGIPSFERVTRNTDYRVTVYNTNNISSEEGQIYSVKIPEALRKPEDDYDILVEVTLAYTAKNRRTRQKTKSYLSTWLEWKCSKISDSYDTFKANTLSELDGKKINKSEENNNDSLKWKIRERDVWGEIKDINRNASSLQKDWAIIKSFELPEEMHFAVIAHKGWDTNKTPIPYSLVVSFEILEKNIPIYNEFRIENGIEIPIEV